MKRQFISWKRPSAMLLQLEGSTRIPFFRYFSTTWHTNNNNNTTNTSSNQPNNITTSNTTTNDNFVFSLEDLERVKEQLVQTIMTQENSRIPLPSPGKSSGNEAIDEATKQWRLTNTKDDENLQKLFKSTRTKHNTRAATTLLEQSQMNMEGDENSDDFEVGVEKEELAKYVNPYNPETGEVNGPKGAEPTRFGDWEKSGRCVDF
ncbi:hypothetical protein C9374_006963 [Naegleria lovaniensis]|uniref:Succinate dehydrogenase assembly factor 4, mitochondrial n=1 Tax=Naegleria lovaniensis TaxID=51637 RepID=A0AA88H660_NAELO|nr:uncharacterized protein C9374_006963 [Naegleria lovaniensis]KAG2393432.1 hypothetical protein C9374_006963 [Naegleria lovaniensis]